MTQATRVQVVETVQERRRRSDEEKASILMEAMRPGGSMLAASKRHGVSLRLLYRWKEKLMGEVLLPDCPALPEAEPALLPAPRRTRSRAQAAPVPAPPSAIAPAGFVQVTAVREEPVGVIRACVGSDVACEFPVDMDPGRLAAVVRALRG
jgi:transposase